MVPGTEGERIWGTSSCRTLWTARTPQQEGRSKGFEGGFRTRGPREGHAGGAGRAGKEPPAQHLRGSAAPRRCSGRFRLLRPVPSGCAACV